MTSADTLSRLSASPVRRWPVVRSVDELRMRSRGRRPPPQLRVGIVVVLTGHADVAATLHGVRQQGYPHWTCLVVDDGSPGDAAAAVEPFRLDDGRVRLVRHGAPRGVAASRNTGLRLLDTAVVVFVGAGDGLRPGGLAAATAELAAHWHRPSVVAISAGRVAGWPGSGGGIQLLGCPLRRTAVEECGGFDESQDGPSSAADLVHQLRRRWFRFHPGTRSCITHDTGSVRSGGGKSVHLRRPRLGRGRRADVLLVAESAADVGVLAPLVGRCSSAVRVAAVDIDVLAGDSGATATWSSAGIDVLPYHRAVTSLERASLLAACTPAGPVTTDLVAAAADAGVQVVVVHPPARPAPLPCSAGATDASVGVSPTDAMRRINAVDRRRAPKRSAPASWRGSDFATHLHLEDGPIDPPSIDRLASMRDRHVGETAVVIGNGPSLNETDLDLLAGVPTFGVNAIFLAADRLPEPITYYVVEDTSVFAENVAAIKRFPTEWKLFPAMYRPAFTDGEVDDRTLFFRLNTGFYGRRSGTQCHPRFSLDVTQRVYAGQSVTLINLQLAHWMGFQRVVLIGMDFNYAVPADAERKGSLIVSRSADPNHFHPDYFGVGKSWKDPMLDRVLVCYHLADEIYRATGREIVNATTGGKLELFPRMSLRQALGDTGGRRLD